MRNVFFVTTLWIVFGIVCLQYYNTGDATLLGALAVLGCCYITGKETQ